MHIYNNGVSIIIKYSEQGNQYVGIVYILTVSLCFNFRNARQWYTLYIIT